MTFHQNQNRIRANGGGHTSPDPWTGPDSTIQTRPETENPCYPSFSPYQYTPHNPGDWMTNVSTNPTPTNTGGIPFEEYVDSTTPGNPPTFDTPRNSLSGEPESPDFQSGTIQTATKSD